MAHHEERLAAPHVPAVRVAFDSRRIDEASGIGRYIRSLLPALRALPALEIVETDRPRPKRVDVFHAPSMRSALLRSPVPMVVTLHDLTPLKRRGEILRSGVGMRMRELAVQRAVRVIVPTEVVAADAVEQLGLTADRITVIAEAAAPVLHPRGEDEVAAVRRRRGLPDRYLLWVGGLERPDPRKRIAALADAPRRLPLVLAGPAGRWARELGNVTLTGEVSDDELAAIYTGAQALVFPSAAEGFGLPAVEALACGTPVAACDIPALREVLGDRATFVPVDDLEALVAAGEAATRPAPPPPPFSWDDAAAATLDVYADAAQRRSPASPGH